MDDDRAVIARLAALSRESAEIADAVNRNTAAAARLLENQERLQKLLVGHIEATLRLIGQMNETRREKPVADPGALGWVVLMIVVAATVAAFLLGKAQP
jgi:ABC-type transporter Mla subunit MlaD